MAAKIPATAGVIGAVGQAINQSAAPTFANPGAPVIPGAAGGVPAGSPGSLSGIGSYTPDWAALIKGDPGLLAAQSALGVSGVASLAQRNAAIQQAYINFGQPQDLTALAAKLGMSAADIQQALGPGANQLAQENTAAGLSTEARLGQANTTAIRNIKNQLNARGMLNSGETGYQLDQQDLSYRQAQSDATNSLLGYLQQYQQGYLSAQQQNQQSLAQAYSDAANRQLANNHSYAGVSASFSHVDSAGHAVYLGQDGNYYNSDGSPYTPPAPVAAPATPNASGGAYSWGIQGKQ